MKVAKNVKTNKKLFLGIILLLIITIITTAIIINNAKVKDEKIALQEEILAFENCEYLLNEDSSIAITGYSGSADIITIPAEIEGKKVTSVNVATFENDSDLEKILVAKDVAENIGKIKNFEISEEDSNDEYVVYKTTKKYNESYLSYAKLPAKERLVQGDIPRKFDITEEEKQEVQERYASLSSEIPTTYDLRDYITIEVENQNPYGICYAYANLTSVETNMALNNNVLLDLSDAHLAGMTWGAGGFFIDRSDYAYGKYYIDEEGPIPDSELPISVVNLANTPVTALMSTYFKDATKDQVSEWDIEAIISELSTKTPEVFVSQTVRFGSITPEDRDTIKQHIMKYGSVYAGISMDSNYYDYYGSPVALYKPKEGTERSDGHAVSIIGWDDNFSVDNFKSGCRPQNPGAWLILNSWGDDFGDAGCFWVSYEDGYVNDDLYGVITAEQISTDITKNSFTITNTDESTEITDGKIQRGTNVTFNYNATISSASVGEEVTAEIFDNENNLCASCIKNISGTEISAEKVADVQMDIDTFYLNPGKYTLKITYNGKAVREEFEITRTTFDFIAKQDGTVAITGYNGNDTNLVIPEEIFGHEVTEIIENDENSYWLYIESEYGRINSITVPATVNKITIELSKIYTIYGTDEPFPFEFIDPTRTIIYGYKNSYIETYAAENNYTFIPLDDCEEGTHTISYDGWSFDGENNKLIINGDLNFDYNSIPWSEYINFIYSAEVTGEATKVPDFAFRYCLNLYDVKLTGSALKSIGQQAFDSGYSNADLPIDQLYIPNTVEEFRPLCFLWIYECKSYGNIKLS